ncbi:MAG: SDR family oxidoreductase [Actinomycetota bacterium]|nr:SDR family oxidoreductase [Actinomycetota bacterium]
MSGFAGRRALVTGGASGIGRAVATRLEGAGAAVAVVDREGPIAADVREPVDVVRAVEVAAEALAGPPDVLVNCAGIYRIGPFLELRVEEWDDVLATNLRSSFLVGQAVASALVAARTPGAIVNVASIAATRADVAEPAAHYNASKAGVVALTRQMAAELAPHRIRVNAVAPGVIETPMLRLTDDPERARAYLETSVPLGRLGAADEVAAAICFLASDDAAYVTGACLAVDGGAAVV